MTTPGDVDVVPPTGFRRQVCYACEHPYPETEGPMTLLPLIVDSLCGRHQLCPQCKAIPKMMCELPFCSQQCRSDAAVRCT